MGRDKGTLPNFIVVGAARSGTTSLFYYLLQHPDIYVPKRKECMFFSGIQKDFHGRGEIFKKSIVSDLQDYKKLFSRVKNEKAIGEVSPDYLYYYDKSIKNIKIILGSDVKIIIILRNPVERAYSHYLHHVRYGIEELSFEDALHAEAKRMEECYFWAFYYAAAGFYYPALNSYFSNFPNVKVYLYDDLERSPLDLMRNIYSFLTVDSAFIPDVSSKYNVSGEYKNAFIKILSQKTDSLKKMFYPVFKQLSESQSGRKTLERVLSKVLVKPKLKAETRRYLQALFREDILQTQDLIQRDLSSWL